MTNVWSWESSKQIVAQFSGGERQKSQSLYPMLSMVYFRERLGPWERRQQSDQQLERYTEWKQIQPPWRSKPAGRDTMGDEMATVVEGAAAEKIEHEGETYLED